MKSPTNSEISRCSLRKNEPSGTSAVTSSTAEGQSQAAEPPIQVLRQRVLQLVDTVDTAQRRCDELNLQEAASRSQQQALADQLTALTQERDQLGTERDALAASLLELNSQRDSLEAERNALQTERDDLSSRLLTLTGEFQELASQRQELSGQLEALSSLRDGLQQERDRLNAEQSELKVERDKLQEEKNRLETDIQQLRAVLEHVFPYETYKEKRADLSQHDDSQLIDHFARSGINEGVDLCHAAMKQRLEDCQKENRKLHKENALIQQELSKAQIHMELLKELVGR